MATVSLTFTDSENGVVSSSFTISEENIRRIYAAMRDTYEEIENKEPEQSDNEDDDSEPKPREKVIYTNKDVCRRIAYDFVEQLINGALNAERRILMRGIEIKPIKVMD